MSVLLTYDIKKTSDTIHTEVKDTMKKKGYSEILKGETANVKLPNTTLVRSNIAPEKAGIDLKAVCAEKKATLERYVALNYDGGEVADFT